MGVVIKAEFLDGLPGTGPKPFHFHTGKPTPWREGAVVRVISGTGADWIANVQNGLGYSTHIVEWPQARAFVVFASGATYFLSVDSPRDGQAITTEGVDCLIAPDGTVALVNLYDGVTALRPDGSVVWSNRWAIDGFVNMRIEDGKVFGDAGIDSSNVWDPFVLRLADGVMLSPR